MAGFQTIIRYDQAGGLGGEFATAAPNVTESGTLVAAGNLGTLFSELPDYPGNWQPGVVPGATRIAMLTGPKQYVTDGEGTLRASTTLPANSVGEFTTSGQVWSGQPLEVQSMTNDGRVKMIPTSELRYLQDLVDGTTIKNTGGVLKVYGIDGVTATVFELNTLVGAKSNLQQQIDNLSSVGNFVGAVDNYADLSTIVDPAASSMAIVLEDVNHGGKSTIYIYDGTAWVYVGEFKAGEIRNFTTDPINLVTETTGVLPKTRYQFQNATETPIDDTGGVFTSTNVEGALLELFNYANSIKTAVASAIGAPLLATDTVAQMVSKIDVLKTNLAKEITDQGVPTDATDSLVVMADNVRAITCDIPPGSVKWYMPNMTSNTTPVPYVASNSGTYPGGGYPAWRAFSGNILPGEPGDCWANDGNTPAWIGLDFGSPTPVDRYELSLRGAGSYRVATMVNSWKIQGSMDGSSFVDIVDQDYSLWTVVNASVEFAFPAKVEYRYYRLLTKSVMQPAIGYTCIGQLRFGVSV